MRKVIGIGETILDIIFNNNQPSKAVPGGSVFNCMISLGRCGIPASFISELGNDKVGKTIKGFMEENNLSSDFIDVFERGNSPVALAFLDENNNAEYVFYKNFPAERLNIDFPVIEEDDIVVFGSYFALNPVLRDKMLSFLEYARQRNAIIYYDINFRKPHAHERLKLELSFLKNFEFSDIVRCSDEDLSVLYSSTDFDKIYTDQIAFYCKNFIMTSGSEGVKLKTKTVSKHYPVPQIEPVSTIGAGDNFNAGILYGILKYNVSYNQLNDLSETLWDQIIAFAIDFASEACLTLDNYVSNEFAAKLNKRTN